MLSVAVKLKVDATTGSPTGRMVNPLAAQFVGTAEMTVPAQLKLAPLGKDVMAYDAMLAPLWALAVNGPNATAGVTLLLNLTVRPLATGGVLMASGILNSALADVVPLLSVTV